MSGPGPSGGHTLVVGYGVTGRAVAVALAGAGVGVVAVEDDPGRDTSAPAGVTVVTAPTAEEIDRLVTGAAQVVTSPGVAVDHPALTSARSHGVVVRSEIELAWGRLERRRPPRPALAAVTGTNGKTTVVTMVCELLAASGLRALSGGNIGLPLIDAVDADVDVVVAEVSSFQLQHTDRWHPKVSCWLNLAPDHLDWHPDLAHYAAAKARIWARQGPGDAAVVNVDDPAVVAAADGLPAGVERIGFGRGPAAPYRDHSPPGASSDPSLVRLVGPGGDDLLAGGVLARALPHDRANALASAAVAFAAGATASGVAAGLVAWRPLRHRVELVARVDGVAWYDDSKATTPASVLAATSGMASVVLIAGGRNKGLDLRALAAAAPPVRHVVALGEAAGEVAAAFAGVVPVTTAPDMGAAVAAAAAVATPGDSVILSPGCASFDQYRSYVERGDDFAARVRALVTPPRANPDRPITEEAHP